MRTKEPKYKISIDLPPRNLSRRTAFSAFVASTAAIPESDWGVSTLTSEASTTLSSHVTNLSREAAWIVIHCCRELHFYDNDKSLATEFFPTAQKSLLG